MKKYFLFIFLAFMMGGIGEYIFYMSRNSNSLDSQDEAIAQVEDILDQSTLFIIKDVNKSEQLLEDARHLALKYELQKTNPAIHKISGQIALEKADYPNALKHFMDANKFYQEAPLLTDHDKMQYASILNYISQVYFLLNRNDKALVYLNKSLILYKALNDTENIINTYRNMGSIFYQQRKYEEALKAYEYLLDMDSIAYTSPKGLMILYSNLGAVNYSLNRLETSLKYLHKAEMQTQKLLTNDSHNTKLRKMLSGIFYNKAIYYDATGDSTKYIDYLLKAMNTLDSIYAPAEIYWPLLKLHEFYGEQENYEKAYGFLLELQTIRDSLFNIENTRQIANLETQERLFQDQQKHEREKHEVERHYWIAVAGLLLILLVVLIYLNIQKNRIIRSEKEREQLTENKHLLESHISKQKQTLTKKEHKVQNLTLKIEEKDQNILSLEERIQQINDTLRRHIHQHKVSNLIGPSQPPFEKEKERKKLLLSLEQISISLVDKLESRFGTLTTRQKLLSALIKHDFTAKEIAILFNISHRSVQTAKYRLKKTFKLEPEQKLEDFLKRL